MNKHTSNVVLNRLEAGSCTGKREYMSMREANEGARIVGQRSRENLIAYQCPFCHLFHVGHPKNEKRREIERAMKRR